MLLFTVDWTATHGHWLLAFASVTGLSASLACLGLFYRARKRLQVQNMLLDDALHHMSQGLCMFDGGGRLMLWNRRFVEIYNLHDRLRMGMTLRDILQQRVEVATLAEDPEAYARLAHAAAAAGETFRHVFDLRDGRHVAVLNAPRPNGGWVSTHDDITDLKKREASFQLLFENNPVPMWVYEPHTLRFLAVNNAAVEHYGYSREQFFAMTILDIRPAEDRERVRPLAAMQDYRSDNTWRHVKADGTQIEVAIFARSLPYEGRSAGICAIVDLTERKRAEDEIRRTQTFLDTIIDNVPTNIVVKELPSFRYLLVNRAGEKQFDLPRDRMIGKTAAEIFPKETADLINARDLEMLESGREQFTDEHVIITPTNDSRIVTTTRFPVIGSDQQP